MNPNAKPFVFSAGAAAWTPGGFTPPTPPVAEPPAPVPASEPVVVEPEVVEEEEEEVDENDPLWKVTLEIAKGDRKAALKLLEDPDALMQYPEVKKMMEEDAGDDAAADVTIAETVQDDWEKQEDSPSATALAVSPAKKAVAAPVDNEDGDDALDSRAAKGGEDDEPEETDADPRAHMNIVFIGHVDAGKSTLSGSILYLMGKVDARTIERFEREAKQRNRDSWFLAFIMDTSEEERAKGKTVEVGRAQFETDIHRYTILDAPGHKNYVPNMISGAAQADIGVLVISARRGEFETGFEKGGQTREHALLAKTLGVRYLVVVINKMDDPTVNWEKERFDECVNKLKPFLRKYCGYVIKRDIRFVPISGLSGANVLNEVAPDVCPWWRECVETGANSTDTPTLISTLDALNISDRDPNGPLRIPVLDKYMERGCIVMGKVESGTVRVGDEIVMRPTRKKAVVEAIYADEKKLRFACPGENVLLKFSCNAEDVNKGYVLSSLNRMCPAVREFVVKLELVDLVEHRPVFTSGYDCVMHVHTAEVEVTVVNLLSVTDEKGVETNKRFGRQGQSCVARMITPLTVCIESITNNPALARVTLRDEGKTIAIGEIVKVIKPTAPVTK
jgi:peptide chain release factor subunit 3